MQVPPLRQRTIDIGYQYIVKKFIFWSASGEKKGNYFILVKISGELRGDLIRAKDTTMVRIKEKKKPSWWQRFFDFFVSRSRYIGNTP